MAEILFNFKKPETEHAYCQALVLEWTPLWSTWHTFWSLEVL